MEQEDFVQLQTLLGPAQNILILTGGNPTLDSFGASLALYLVFSRLGKTVTVACPETPTVGLSNLVGIDKVQSELSGQNLVVSFPYIEGSVEKVSYNIDGDRFNLIIQPRSGTQPFSPQAVKFSHGGATADLIIVLNALDLKDLGSLYEREKDLYDRVPLVTIDHHPENKHYGKVNFVNPYASSTSEIVGLLLTKLGIDYDPDTAHNLLTGIDFATQNFSSPATSPEAFEVAATCLKAGARRISGAFSTPEEKGEGASKMIKPSLRRSPQEPVEEVPPDWLAPKIFKGPNLS